MLLRGCWVVDLQPGRARAAGQVPGVLALLEDDSPHPGSVTPGPDPCVERPRNARSQPVYVPPSLTRESPHLSEAFAMAPVGPRVAPARVRDGWAGCYR